MYQSKSSAPQNTPKHTRRTRTTAKHRSSPKEADSKQFLIGSLKAALISVAAGIALLLLLCAAALSTDDPAAIAPILSRAALILPSLLCGILGAQFTSGAGIASGAVSGIFMTAILFSLGLILPDSEAQPPAFTAIIAGTCILLSCIGGYFRTHSHKKQKPHRKKKA